MEPNTNPQPELQNSEQIDNNPNQEYDYQPVNQSNQSQYQNNNQTVSKTDNIGIVSIIMAFLFPVVGLILGIVGRNKAKKEGYSGTLSSIGIVISSTFIVLTIVALIAVFALTAANSGNTTAKVNDTVGKNNINATYVKLEEYYNINKSYPETINNTYLPTLDSSSLKAFTSNSSYSYVPSGCVENKCRSYIITYNLELNSSDEPSIYTKKSLN
jgi:heme/copper-type cytochrome/quinol oxidase subunit 2